jgi:N-acetylglucosaminyldiphosphoundecaprenol N-acetyl-beta-D-mannosaminyltransferase
MASPVRLMAAAYPVGMDPGSVAPAVSRHLPVVACAGVPIVACTPEEASEEVIRLSLEAKQVGVHVHLCNAYTLALADSDASLRAVLTDSGVNFPDGKSVVWANRLTHRGMHLPSDRVYGPDLMLDVIRDGQAVGLRHFLLGSTDDVLADLKAALCERFPEALVVGSWSPPFRELSDGERKEQAARLVKSGAQVIWVGLGTPKQDFEVTRLAREVSAVHVAVGAAFDFISGSARQAPAWMGRSGLEWAFRLGREPRRLGRRYLFGNLRFLGAATRVRR